ncbi:MAG: aminotransferase class [Rariglobus sp.]|jgi:branched-subunit amino acid aminotransferase/4-amino-4-deoxychorismate lyase|nr:aminotransferase class [Rariglobus sp.]
MPSTAHVLLDNLLLSAESARISANSEGFLYGHGVFETIKVIDGRPAFLAQHHARLTASALALDLPYAVDLATLRDRLRRVITANTLANGSAKVVLFNHGDTTGELITTKASPYPPETYTRGFRLKTVFTGERTGGLAAHKTLNYLASIRARRTALAAGFDEALFLTPAGIVIEGAATNLFIVRDGIAFTPSLASGPLPGIARAGVLALLGPARAREMILTTSDLHHASEVFVTNALLGVMPVSRLDDRALDLARAPVTQALLSSYRLRETASLS